MHKDFKLISNYQPAGDQPAAITGLLQGLKDGLAHQVLLGVTGSGKTYTIANVIQEIQRPTLILAHNKTLAAQLYGEMKEYFPGNAVEYFVSYYDYYQPEAYVPASDTYIEKDASINEHIEQMRLSATKALLERPDTIIVATVSAIYGRTVVLNGVSKAYSMTGWRIGYVGGPASLINAMKKIQSQSTSNPTSIAQVAAQAALEGDQSYISTSNKIFKERHDYVYEQVNKIAGVECHASEGTFYIFPNFQGVIDRMENISNDIELAEYLLAEGEVAMVPGSAFGAPGYMRISFATSMENLEKAMKRLEKALT